MSLVEEVLHEREDREPARSDLPSSTSLTFIQLLLTIGL